MYKKEISLNKSTGPNNFYVLFSNKMWLNCSTNKTAWRPEYAGYMVEGNKRISLSPELLIYIWFSSEPNMSSSALHIDWELNDLIH